MSRYFWTIDRKTRLALVFVLRTIVSSFSSSLTSCLFVSRCRSTFLTINLTIFYALVDSVLATWFSMNSERQRDTSRRHIIVEFDRNPIIQSNSLILRPTRPFDFSIKAHRQRISSEEQSFERSFQETLSIKQKNSSKRQNEKTLRSTTSRSISIDVRHSFSLDLSIVRREQLFGQRKTKKRISCHSDMRWFLNELFVILTHQ